MFEPKLKTPEVLVFPRGTLLCQSDRSRRWLGKLVALNPALCKTNNITNVIFTDKIRNTDFQICTYEKLHVLHNDSRPQVKVLLYDLQQLIFVPVRRAVVKH